MNPKTNAAISNLTFPPKSLFSEAISHISMPETEHLHYDGNLPDWTEAEMERLYQNIFSSSVLFRANGQAHEISAYINRVGGETASILLFRTENRRVRVLNELIPLHPHEIRDFAAYIFAAMPGTRSITFNAIKTDELDLAYPYQRHNYTEDTIIELPANSKQYHEILGKNLRKTIRRYSERIEQDCPSFDYVVLNGSDVSEEHILRIVEFNRARMSQKNKESSADEAEIKWFLDCVRHFDGMAVLAIADGKICAGQVCCRSGGHFFMLIVGHDPALDHYRLGTLCQYRAICEAIERGGKACHFLWGREEYKYRFLGVRYDFDKIVIYPSHVGMLLEAQNAALVLAQAKMRQARLWIVDPQNQNKPLPKLAKWLKGTRQGEKSSTAASANT